jgi:hypothetical protein
VALTVTCTVCAAQQIGLSSSATSLADGWHPAITGSVRPEQKTTPVLAPYRSSDLLVSRKQPVDASRILFGAKEFGSIVPVCQMHLLSCQSTAGETTRGPPLMDPPRLC